MENPIPFDLNEAIRHWQQNLNTSPIFGVDDLEELASHLRASVQRLKAEGHPEEQAFQIAVRRIGERGPLEREFCKVNRPAGWSLSVLSFWIVAGLYLLQVSYSLVEGMVAWREMMEGRAFQRFMAGGPSVQQAHNYVVLHSLHYSRYFAPIMSVVMVLFFLLCARLVTGSWKNIGKFLKSFQRPIRSMLGLVILGLLIIILPAFLPGLLSAIPSVHMRIWAPQDGLLGRVTLNIVLVFLMVMLGKQGLRKISPDDGTAHNRAASNSH